MTGEARADWPGNDGSALAPDVIAEHGLSAGEYDRAVTILLSAEGIASKEARFLE